MNLIDPSGENVPRVLLGKTAVAAKFHLFSWIPVPKSLKVREHINCTDPVCKIKVALLESHSRNGAPIASLPFGKSAYLFSQHLNNFGQKSYSGFCILRIDPSDE